MAGILIVDDTAFVRQAVRDFLQCQSLAVCGEAGDGREAIQKAQELLPDIVLLDVVMPRMGGIEAAHEILRILPSVKIVFLTMHTPSSIGQAITSCSHGFVSKVDAGTQLVPTLKRLLQPEEPLAPTVPGRRTGAERYIWQKTVVDAFAAPRNLLPGTINVAERAIAARLTDANEPNRDERLALKEALRALSQLISETKPAKQKNQKEGVA